MAEDTWVSLGPGYSESVYHCAFEVALRGPNLKEVIRMYH
jgi:hypothetical protein